MLKIPKIKMEVANGPVPKGLEPQSDESPIVYLGHHVAVSTELNLEQIRCAGIRYKCFSFVFTHPGEIFYNKKVEQCYYQDKKLGLHLMLDSGAFSFHRFVTGKLGPRLKSIGDVATLREDTLRRYIEFCKVEGKSLDFYVTFDYEKKQSVVREITGRIRREGLHPIPIFHGGEGLDFLKRWLDDGCMRIGIGSLGWRLRDYDRQKRYYDEVFRVVENYKGVKTHGFAATGLSVIMGWPWTTVDSSTWARWAFNGGIWTIDPFSGKASQVTVSNRGSAVNRCLPSLFKRYGRGKPFLSKEAAKSVRDKVEKDGWDFDLLQRSMQYRSIYNAYVLTHLHKFKKQLGNYHVRWGALV